MPDTKANQIIHHLRKAHDNISVSAVTHEISADTFLKQKQKLLAHGGGGGVIGIILTPDDKIVLAHRSQLNAGWSLPGGTVEKDESFETALHREIHEEIGVKISSAKLVSLEKKRFVSPEGEELYFVLATYLTHIQDRILPAPTKDAQTEGLKIQLFDRDKLPQEMIFGDREKITRFVANQQKISIPS